MAEGAELGKLTLRISADVSEYVRGIGRGIKKLELFGNYMARNTKENEQAIKRLTASFGNLEGQLRIVSGRGALFGVGMKDSAKATRVLNSAIDNLLAKGLKPTSPVIARIKHQLDELKVAQEVAGAEALRLTNKQQAIKKSANEAAVAQKRLQDIMANLRAATMASTLGQVSGGDLGKSLKTQIAAHQRALKDLIRANVPQSSEAFKGVVRDLGALQQAYKSVQKVADVEKQKIKETAAAARNAAATKRAELAKLAADDRARQQQVDRLVRQSVKDFQAAERAKLKAAQDAANGAQLAWQKAMAGATALQAQGARYRQGIAAIQAGPQHAATMQRAGVTTGTQGIEVEIRARQHAIKQLLRKGFSETSPEIQTHLLSLGMLRNNLEATARSAKVLADAERSLKQATSATNSMMATAKETGRKYASAYKDIEKAANKATGAQTKFKQSGVGLHNVAAAVGKIATAYIALKSVGRILEYGAELNSQLEQATVAIGAVVSATNDIFDAQGKQLQGQEKINVAMEISGGLVKALRKDALQYGLKIDQLVSGYQAVAASAARLKLPMKDVRTFATETTVAMRAMKIPMDQQRQELQDLINADIDRNSHLAKNLQLRSSILKTWQKEGTFVENMRKLLVDYVATGKRFRDTWEGSLTAMKASFQESMAILTDPLMAILKKVFSELADFFQSGEWKAFIIEWQDILLDALEGAIDLGRKLGLLLMDSASWFKVVILDSIREASARLGALTGRTGETAVASVRQAIMPNAMARLAASTIQPRGQFARSPDMPDDTNAINIARAQLQQNVEKAVGVINNYMTARFTGIGSADLWLDMVFGKDPEEILQQRLGEINRVIEAQLLPAEVVNEIKKRVERSLRDSLGGGLRAAQDQIGDMHARNAAMMAKYYGYAPPSRHKLAPKDTGPKVAEPADKQKSSFSLEEQVTRAGQAVEAFNTKYKDVKFDFGVGDKVNTEALKLKQNLEHISRSLDNFDADSKKAGKQTPKNYQVMSTRIKAALKALADYQEKIHKKLIVSNSYLAHRFYDDAKKAGNFGALLPEQKELISTEFLKELREDLQKISDVAYASGDKTGGISDQITRIKKALDELAPVLGPGNKDLGMLGALLENLRKQAAASDDPFGDFNTALGDFLEGIGKAAKPIEDFFKVFDPDSNNIGSIGIKLLALVDSLGSFFDGVGKVAKALPDLGKNAQDALFTVLQALEPVSSWLDKYFFEPWAKMLGPTLKSLFETVPNAIGTVVKESAEKLAKWFIAGWETFIAAAPALAKWVKAGADKIGEWSGELGKWAKQLADSFIEAFTKLINDPNMIAIAILAALIAAIAIVVANADKLAEMMEDVWDSIFDPERANAKAKVNSAAKTYIEALQSIAAESKLFKGSLGEGLREAGYSFDATAARVEALKSYIVELYVAQAKGINVSAALAAKTDQLRVALERLRLERMRKMVKEYGDALDLAGRKLAAYAGSSRSADEAQIAYVESTIAARQVLIDQALSEKNLTAAQWANVRSLIAEQQAAQGSLDIFKAKTAANRAYEESIAKLVVASEALKAQGGDRGIVAIDPVTKTTKLLKTGLVDIDYYLGELQARIEKTDAEASAILSSAFMNKNGELEFTSQADLDRFRKLTAESVQLKRQLSAQSVYKTWREIELEADLLNTHFRSINEQASAAPAKFEAAKEKLVEMAKAGQTGTVEFQRLLAEVTQAKASVERTSLFENIRNGLRDALRNGLQGGIADFLSGANTLAQSMYDSLRNAIVSAISDAIVQSAVVKGAFGNLLAQLSDQIISRNFTGAKDTINKLKEESLTLLNDLGPVLVEFRKMITSVLPKSGANIVSEEGNAENSLANVLTGFADLAGLPKMATGGIVSQATRAVVGEGGVREAIIPLSKDILSMIGAGIAQSPAVAALGATSGGQTVVIQISGNRISSDKDADELGEKIVRRLRQMGMKF